MTLIRIRPLEQTGTALRAVPAKLTARPSFPYYVDKANVVVPGSEVWTFDPGQPDPAVELLEPVGYAWQLTLRYATGFVERRTVVFVGEALDWGDLTDVDPATLATLSDEIGTPTGKTLITREETIARFAAFEAEEAGGLDFTLLFENGLI